MTCTSVCKYSRQCYNNSNEQTKSVFLRLLVCMPAIGGLFCALITFEPREKTAKRRFFNIQQGKS